MHFICRLGVGHLWRSGENPFYGEPQSLSVVYPSPVAAEEGVLVAGVACGPRPIPPLEAQDGVPLPTVGEDSGCSAWPPGKAPDAPKLAHFSYTTGLSANVTSMPSPTYRFLSEREGALASRQGMTVFGIQVGPKPEPCVCLSLAL